MTTLSFRKNFGWRLLFSRLCQINFLWLILTIWKEWSSDEYHTVIGHLRPKLPFKWQREGKIIWQSSDKVLLFICWRCSAFSRRWLRKFSFSVFLYIVALIFFTFIELDNQLECHKVEKKAHEMSAKYETKFLNLVTSETFWIKTFSYDSEA